MSIRFSIIVPVFLATIVASMILTSCQSQEPAYVKPPAIVTTQPVEQSSPQTEAHYSAVVQPSEQVDLAFKGSGYVQSILQVRGSDGRMRTVQEGDIVKRGTVLARIDTGDYQSRVNQQKAAVEEVTMSKGRVVGALTEAEAALEQARLDYERTSRLFQSESATKPEYEAAKSRLDIAQARTQEARAQIESSRATQDRANAALQEVRLAMRDCSLKAPIDGVVLKRNIEAGSLAAQGAVAFTLANARVVKVAIGVPDVELQNLKLGQPLTVMAEAAPGQVFHGTVTDISPAADPRSRVFNVEVSLPNPGQQLRIGMVASLSVDHGGSAQPNLTVPLTAVVRSTVNPDGYAVFTLKEQAGKYIAQEQQVKLGEAYGNFIAVLDGVKLGDRVVTNGSTRIASGQEVTVSDQNL